MATSITARADISVRFIESAPKDRFVIENVGACAEGALEIEIDLATAPVGLIFDTTASGAGVEVFQPFEVAAGGDVLAEAILPTDGDASVQLSLTGLAPGGSFAFTVDVDDTGERSDLGQIRVSDAEIAGASVSINGETALFGGDAVALLPSACIS
ncbi:MAG: aggregation factor core [Pseudomonadota bacterium]